MAASTSVFALGFGCGRVAVYEAKSLSLLFLFQLAMPSAPGVSKFGGLDGKPEFKPAVRTLLLLNNGSCLVSLHEDGALHVVPSIFNPIKFDSTPAGSVIDVPLRTIESNPNKSKLPIRLVKCSGDDCMFGVIRFGCVMEIFRIIFTHPLTTSQSNFQHGSIRESNPMAMAAVSPVLFGLIRNFDTKYSSDMEIMSARLVRNGGWLIVCVMGLVTNAVQVTSGLGTEESPLIIGNHSIHTTTAAADDEESCHLFVGAVNMLTAPAKAANTSLLGKMPHIAVYEKLMVSPSTSIDTCSVAFAGHYCVVITSLGLFTINLLTAAVANTLGDSFAIVENVIRSYAISVGENNSWAYATVAIATSSPAIATAATTPILATKVELELDGHSSYFPNSKVNEPVHVVNRIENTNPSTSYNIFVHRGDKPALLRFTFQG